MAQLRGRVKDSAGGLGGVKVQISWWKWTKTDMLGFYNLGSVGTGRKTVVFTQNGYRRIQMAVTINPGPNTLNVTMDLITGSLTGKVTDAVGNLPGVLVTVGTGTGAPSGVTNANGDYTIPGIIPGSYQVSFVKAGYTTVIK
jgi:hypothetical protein